MNRNRKLLEIMPDGLKLGGEKFYLATGDFHYFRTLPGGWHRRLALMKEFGLTAVQTYVPWNLHERNEGEFDFTGRLDIAAFLKTADELGLKVMLRPSPYICSECDGGGLPWWLLRYPDAALRCNNERYMSAVSAYYKRLCAEFVPYLSANGGPVIAVAIENEYGSYGNDKAYLNALREILVSNGADVPFYTTDGYSKTMFKCGTLPEVWEGVNYRIESSAAIKALRDFQPDKPPYIGEYWSGRSMHWDEPYSKREVQPIAEAYKTALELGGLVNFYMFCGGTNFGFFSGANYGQSFSHRKNAVNRYIPLTTSYDCDALVSEDGAATPKYYACKKMLDEFTGNKASECTIEAQPESQEIGVVKLDEHYDLIENIKAAASSVKEYAAPPTFEEAGIGYGYILYSTYIYGPSAGEKTLTLPELHDRATVYLNGKYAGWAMRERKSPEIRFEIPDEGARLDILVENMGRICFGQYLCDRKGLLGGVNYGVRLFGWTVYTLPMENIPQLYNNTAEAVSERPGFWKGHFKACAGIDTFVRLDGWNRGVVFVNGFNLGRYWKAGPQKTLYLPGELLHEGDNTIEVFEIHSPDDTHSISLVKSHELDGEVGADDSNL